MNPQTVGIVGFLVMVALIFLRMPVAIALGLVGTVGYAVLNGWTQAFLVLSRVPLTFASAYDLSVVPLFVLMGAIAAHSGMARELFQSINVMFSGRRGTLATATIGACAALGAVSGSSVAMVATMSRVAVPEMRRAGYDERLALGSVVAGGTLGILIPPSVMLIFYGLSAVQSIPKLFAAGMIPGLLLAALQIGVVKTATWFAPHWAPVSPRAPWRERLHAALGMWKLLFIFLLSIGGIYAGWFSPTEAAAVGTFATIVIAGLTGQLTVRRLVELDDRIEPHDSDAVLHPARRDHVQLFHSPDPDRHEPSGLGRFAAFTTGCGHDCRYIFLYRARQFPKIVDDDPHHCARVRAAGGGAWF